MTRLLLLLLLLSCLLAGCGGSKSAALTPESALLERITDFSLALGENNITAALKCLSATEKARFLEGSESLSPEMEERLRFFPLKRLRNNPRIRLVNGQLEGLYETMVPPLGLGGPDGIILTGNPLEAAPRDEPAMATPDPEYLQQMEQTRKALLTSFWEAAQADKWEIATALLDDQEAWVLLEPGTTSIKDTVRKRFLDMPEKDRQSMTLSPGGKLAGFIFLLPP